MKKGASSDLCAPHFLSVYPICDGAYFVDITQQFSILNYPSLPFCNNSCFHVVCDYIRIAVYYVILHKQDILN